MTPVIIIHSATSTALAPSLWFLIMILIMFVLMYLTVNGVELKKASLAYLVVGVILIPVCVATENKVNSRVIEDTSQELINTESTSFMRKMDKQNNQQRLANINIIGGKSD